MRHQALVLLRSGGRSLSQPDEDVGGDGLGSSPDPKLTQGLHADVVADGAERRFADHYLARLGVALQARSEVGRVADRGETALLGGADVPHDRRTGVDADPEARAIGPPGGDLPSRVLE